MQITPARACPTASSRVRAPRRRRRGQGGFGLIEVLVTLVLASITVLGLVAGLLTLLRTTEGNEQRQQVQLALGNLSEVVRSIDYQDCDTSPLGATPATYQDLIAAATTNWVLDAGSGELEFVGDGPVGMTAWIDDVQHWDPTARQFVGSCSGSDAGAQQLTVVVDWQDRTGQAQTVIGSR